MGIILKTILLPLDESPLAERALPYAVLLARRSQARTVLVEAIEAHTRLGAALLRRRAAVLGARSWHPGAAGHLGGAYSRDAVPRA